MGIVSCLFFPSFENLGKTSDFGHLHTGAFSRIQKTQAFTLKLFRILCSYGDGFIDQLRNLGLRSILKSSIFLQENNITVRLVLIFFCCWGVQSYFVSCRLKVLKYKLRLCAAPEPLLLQPNPMTWWSKWLICFAHVVDSLVIFSIFAVKFCQRFGTLWNGFINL